MQAIPGVKEWAGDPDDLDLQYAQEVFLGKSLEEAQQLFGENPIERTSNLRWMPPEPFRYYVRALAAYLQQEHALSDLMISSAASCFLRLMEEKLADAPRTIAPVLPELMPVAEYVARNQDIFDADVAIFGDFLQLYEQIKTLSASL